MQVTLDREVVVLPVGQGAWKVQFADGTLSWRLYDDKAEAIGHAKALARNARACLVVHGTDGSVQGRRNFGPEANPYVC